MIGEQMDILNNDFFNQKLESLNRRIEQIQCKKIHEEIAQTLLKKVSKLERRIDALIAFQEEAVSKMAIHQTMLPSPDNQKKVLNQLEPSAFCSDIINIPTSSSNMLLQSPYTGFTSAHVSEYISSDEVILVSVQNQNSATANNSAIPNNQMSTQAEISTTVQSEMKERKRKVIDLSEEENHDCSKVVPKCKEKEKIRHPPLHCLQDGLELDGKLDFLKTFSNGKGTVFKQLDLKEQASLSPRGGSIVTTSEQFPHLPLLPRIPLCPELAEEFKDLPQNPETKSGLCAKSEGDCTVTDLYRN